MVNSDKILHKLILLEPNLSYFRTPGVPDGVHSNRPCPVVRMSVFKYLGDRSLVFSSFLHEVRAP